MTDKEIIELLKRSPEQGLGAVVKRYTAYLLKIARTKLDGICTAEDIEEAVSDIFFIFYQKGMESGFEIRSVRAYLSLIAERHCTDIFRRHIKQNENIPLDDISDKLVSQSNDTEHDTLAEMIKRLGEPDTSIFIRKYFFGQKNADIAKELHMKTKTVDKRISRGLVKLRKMFEEEK